MKLFYCAFDEDSPWLVSAKSKEDAEARGKERTGTAPSLVVPYEGDIALEVQEKEHGDEVELQLVPDEDTADALLALSEAAEDVLGDTDAAPDACPSVGYDDNDREIPCELGINHAGKKHFGEGMEWE